MPSACISLLAASGDTISAMTYTNRSRQSNPLFLPMIIIGGLMGILAGYGGLALLRENGIGPLTEKAVPINERRSGLSSKTPARFSIEPSRTARSSAREIPTQSTERRPIARQRPPTITPRDVAEDPLPFGPPVTHKKVEKPMPLPRPRVAAGALPKPSAIVPLALDKSVIRVVAVPAEVPVGNLLCDIAFTPNLLDSVQSDDPFEYRLVVEKLGNRGKYLHELPLHIKGAGAAIEITVLHQTNAAVCEIRPRFSLPISGIEQLTIARGSIIHNKLTRSLNDAANARQSLDGMRTDLTSLKSQLAAAQRATTAYGSNPAETGVIRHNATMATTRLNRAVSSAEKSVSRAEQLVADEPAMRTELADLNEIADYAKSIASVATIYVRFYSGDITLPATVK